MPAVLSPNLHSGFLNEEYGIFLLRQIAAVAPIGRAEDHGIDAIATLLPSANGYLHAADTFLIQFKSVSVKKVNYGGKNKEGDSTEHIVGELPWLRSLQMPLLFGSVSRLEKGAPGKLKLFGSHVLFEKLFLGANLSEISICFDPEDARPTLTEKNEAFDEFAKLPVPQEGNEREFRAREQTRFFEEYQGTSYYLGDPVVEFGLAEIQHPQFREVVIGIIQTYVRLVLRNIAIAPVGLYRPITVITNKPAIAGDFHRITSPGDLERSKAIWEASHLPLEALAAERMHVGSEADVADVLRALDVLRNLGVVVTSKSDLQQMQICAKKVQE
jgi:hypothetical protein